MRSEVTRPLKEAPHPPIIVGHKSNRLKGSEENFGYSEDDKDVCIEFADNSYVHTKFYYSEDTWTKYNLDRAYEFRFPDSRFEFEESTELDKDIPKVIEAYDDLKYLNMFITAYDGNEEGISETVKAERKQVFKQYFGRWFEQDATLFYYLWTDFFLMTDQRQKNMMIQHYGEIIYDDVSITTSEGTKTFKIPKTDSPRWFFAIYDSDTCLGITNNGTWFSGESYTYEDDSLEDGEHVYNGWDSLLWNNVKLNYMNELKTIYGKVRTTETGKTPFTYEYIDNMFDTHQAKWPERIWNEDSYYSYIVPDGHTAKLNGNKKLQRKFWLYNRFKYMDSKYYITSADIIKVRVNINSSDSIYELIKKMKYDENTLGLTLTSANDIYGCVQWTGDDFRYAKLAANEPYVFECPLTTATDQEVYIYSASSLLDIGNLSEFKCGKDTSFANATKLLKLILCDRDHSNPTYTATLTLPSYAPHLKEIYLCNCTNFGITLDLSSSKYQCPNIEIVDLYGSNATGLTLDDDVPIQEIYLPATTTAITLHNTQDLTKFQIQGMENLTTIDITYLKQLGSESGYAIDVMDLIAGIESSKKASATINWGHIQWGSTDSRLTSDAYEQLIQDLEDLYWVGGHSGAKTEKAYGTFNISSSKIYCATSSGGQQTRLSNMFGNGITVDPLTATYEVKFFKDEAAKEAGTVLWTKSVTRNTKLTYGGTSPTPPTDPEYKYQYTWSGWKDENGTTYGTTFGKTILKDESIVATYSQTLISYTVNYYQLTV